MLAVAHDFDFGIRKIICHFYYLTQIALCSCRVQYQLIVLYFDFLFIVLLSKLFLFLAGCDVTVVCYTFPPSLKRYSFPFLACLCLCCF